MATASVSLPAKVIGPAHTGTGRIPWYLWMLVAALLLVTAGGQADVSWHRSIGRDSFWTPPHLMVYTCGLLAAIACGYLLWASNFGRREGLRRTSVEVFGLRAPLGVLVTAWGGLVMLYSAPFDNWWHNAYGLDVQVASPPHIVLLAGTWAVTAGTLLLTEAHLNRARASGLGKADVLPFRRLFLFTGSLAVIHLMSYSMTYTFDIRLHQAKPYFVMATAVPFVLATLAGVVHRPGRPRQWTATTIAVIYTSFMLVMVWGLPLIPATPHLGPVFEQVTHMIPPKFPILLLAPCLALDLLWQRGRSAWLTAAASGVAYVLALVAAEWPFATFLMSSAADNRFFAARALDFSTPANSLDALRLFERPQHGLPLAAGLMAAAIAAAVALRLGQLCGGWMREVQR